MEKYKDLIITLIKNHRKYQGCEDILDEIVEEVISKAKTVVENVSDETTVRNYLIKTVSTAMIIVPKRHNISTRMIRRSALSGMILPKSMTEQSPEFEQEDILQQLEEETVEDSNLEIEDSITEQMLDDEQTVENDTPILEETFDNKEEEEEEEISPILDEEFDTEEVTPILEVEPEFEEDSTDLVETPILDEPDVEQPVLEEPTTEDNKYDNTLVDRMINEIAPEDSGIVYDENENNDIDELETLLDSEDIDSLEIQGDEIQELNEPEEQIDDIAEEPVEEAANLNTDEGTSDDEIAYALPNLEVFKAEPIDNPIDISEIRSDLSAFIEKHPDMYYGEIWKLKYVENKSADNIAEILNLDVDTVLERLEDLISVVED